MPGGERDDGLSPVCHPTPRPPSCPLPYWQKRPKTFPRQTRVGEGMNRSRALYQNSANLSLLRWQICKDSYCNILLFFLKAISWVIGSCFDYTKLTISLPGWLCCTVKDHRAVFPPSSLCTPTHKHEHTDRKALYTDAEHSLTSQRRIKHVELFGVFQISGDQIIFV